MDRRHMIVMLAGVIAVAGLASSYMRAGHAQGVTTVAQPTMDVYSPELPQIYDAKVIQRQSLPVDIVPLSSAGDDPLSETLMTPHLPAPQPAAPLPQDMPVSTLPRDGGSTLAAAARCARDMTLDVASAAMLSARIVAPCDAGKRVVLDGNGLVFAARMPVSGPLELSIPAMASDASVSARFAQGAALQATADVPELALFDRVAVQWLGRDGFDLHALEFGAAYGSNGDVSAAHPRAPSDAVLDRGGFVTALGAVNVDQPLRALVYTYPAGLASRDGKVTLALEAPITKANCGRKLLGETLRLQDGVADHADLSVAMPACDAGAEGQFLALNGLLPPLTVRMAAN